MSEAKGDGIKNKIGIKVFKWPHKQVPTQEAVQEEMKAFGYTVYDLQTIPPWYDRSAHAHDYDEIRGAVSGCTTFYFDDFFVTLEPGDIILVPAGTVHKVVSHNGNPFSAFKGSSNGIRSVTEHASMPQ